MHTAQHEASNFVFVHANEKWFLLNYIHLERNEKEEKLQAYIGKAFMFILEENWTVRPIEMLLLCKLIKFYKYVV